MHAFDLRGHGQTNTRADDDLSMETLVQDTLGILEQIVPPMTPKVDGDAESESPQTILVGHRCENVALQSRVFQLARMF